MANAHLINNDFRAIYQIRRTWYASNIRSLLTMGMFSLGPARSEPGQMGPVVSRQQAGALPVFHLNSQAGKPECEFSPELSHKRFESLVLNSHADAALTKTSDSKEDRIDRALRESFGSSVAHQIRVRASTRTRIHSLLPFRKLFGRQRLKVSGTELKFTFEHSRYRFSGAFLTGTGFTAICFPRATTSFFTRSPLSIMAKARLARNAHPFHASDK
jgi:hypothetical protein